MKEERNIITMDGQGNISLPSDIGATAMTEWEICELFGVIAPTVRAGIKALCKSGILKEYDIKRIIRLSDKYSIEVYNIETITAPRFPCRIVRGGESPQSVVGKNYARAKRQQHDFSFAECRQSSSHIVMKSCRTVVLESLNL